MTLISGRESGRHGVEVVMGSLAVLVAAMLWGTTGLAAHFAPAGVSPFAIGAGSMGFGGVFLALLGHRSEGRRIEWRRYRAQLAAGAPALVAYPLCFYGSMHYAGIAVGTAITIGSSPIMATLIEVGLGRAHITFRRVAAGVVAVVGLVLLTLGGAAHSHGGAHNPAPNPTLGIALALGAGFTYAAYTAAAHSMIADGCPSRVAMGRIFGVAALALLPLCLVLGGPLLTTGRGLTVLAYLAFVPMGLAYVLFATGLRTTSPSTAVTLTLVEPVVAAVLAVSIVHEPMTLVGWFGMALVLVGVLLFGGDG